MRWRIGIKNKAMPTDAYIRRVIQKINDATNNIRRLQNNIQSDVLDIISLQKKVAANISSSQSLRLLNLQKSISGIELVLQAYKLQIDKNIAEQKELANELLSLQSEPNFPLQYAQQTILYDGSKIIN